jgi:uncharacterized protein
MLDVTTRPVSDPRLARLEQEASKYVPGGDPGHDWLHVMRVSEWCKRIGTELGANLTTLLPAALLHANTAHAEAHRSLLTACGFEDVEILAIQSILRDRDRPANQEPVTLESAVLQDAERLDDLGAVGILRVATRGCRIGAGYYNADEPFAFDRALDDRLYCLDHFYKKLLVLPMHFNTAPGSREARRRAQFLRDFIDQLSTEIEW